MIKKARTLSKNYVTDATVTTVGLAPGTNQTYVCIVEELRERLCVLQVVLSLGRSWCQGVPGEGGSTRQSSTRRKRRTRTRSRRFNDEDRILDMHAGMIRHRVDGGQASASAIRTMALGAGNSSSGYTNPTDPWI